MKHSLCALPLLLAAACSQMPTAGVMDLIEARLARQPCVGDLNRWNREYAFRKPVDRLLDTNDVRIWYRETGETNPVGRFVRESTDEWPIDDSRIEMVLARYDIQRDELILEHCGPSFGGSEQPERVVP